MSKTTHPGPNVLFVTVDQWPCQILGCAGHPTIETPTLDRLASLGTRFENAYSECPICIPARRSIMTGTAPRTHGDRDFQPALPMPAGLATLAGTFRDAGYQTQAIGKLHVYPQRDRIGFDDALLAEEGRSALGSVDDYEIFLADKGHAGQQFMHGMSNNEYGWRPWHLPEELHVTNWTTATAARSIRRRDPTRPGLWHVSYTHPHPPLVPLASYLERYRDRQVDAPYIGSWARDLDKLPLALKATRAYWPQLPAAQMADMRRAFYALCTHIDHQLRLLIGTLREEQILADTVILITSDHGDMLGNHGFFAKRLLFEQSAKVPMILVGAAKGGHVGEGVVDHRLVGMQDIMPTLLDLCGVPVPDSCEGLPMTGGSKRESFYAESLSGAKGMRMIRDERYKLIWYPGGNHFQLFDLSDDPREMTDLSESAAHDADLQRLKTLLRAQLYGSDLDLVSGETLVGTPADLSPPPANKGLSGQRGVHYPGPLRQDPSIVAGGAL